tara:strand:+ start:19550 stop:20530 length:981 start_codon:yes stop_codon:yes gene_type:complete
MNQSSGQAKILFGGIDNKEVLEDPKVDPKIKKKIRNIAKHKKYFYEYWKKPATDIYEETYFLKNKAVTYLVIASPFNEIKPKKECFLFMGCFPYLGFFDESDAKEHAQDLVKEDWVTYIRPVYAYSTLGYFDDNILSSFFYYNDIDLAELVFHELFHTIFFVKDDIELNENMANYFGKQMSYEYFEKKDKEIEEAKDLDKRRGQVKKVIVEQVKALNKLYKSNNSLDKSKSEELFENYMQETFLPAVNLACKRFKVNNCNFVSKKWNNASLAAFLTYQNKIENFEKLKVKLGLNLRDFFLYIESKYKEFKKNRPKKKTFDQFLFEN